MTIVNKFRKILHSRRVANGSTFLFKRVQNFIKFHDGSISNILPLNVIENIKTIPIPCSPIEDRILWGFSQDGNVGIP